jgi:Lrp/AsnC family leucine-responsive transcriptional regulator
MTAKITARPDRHQILAALRRDGRQSIQKLSATADISVPARRVRRLEASGTIIGYQALIDVAKLSKPVTVFAEIVLEKQARQGDLEKRLASIEEVVECWEVSGAVDYVARFVCADLAGYQELTNRLIDDPKLGVARIVSHVALRPIRGFAGYPEALLRRKGEPW